jgi:hypothetical protein
MFADVAAASGNFLAASQRAAVDFDTRQTRAASPTFIPAACR